MNGKDPTSSSETVLPCLVEKPAAIRLGCYLDDYSSTGMTDLPKLFLLH
jgi:hypothetical protein